jgi:hypothetical protein
VSRRHTDWGVGVHPTPLSVFVKAKTPIAMMCHMEITMWDGEVIMVHNRLLPTMRPKWYRRRIRLVRPNVVWGD